MISTAVAKGCGRASLGILVLALAWAPFPLGSAVDWGAPVLEILIGMAWLLWAISACFDPRAIASNFRRIWVPGVLVGVVLLWVVIQMTPDFPGLTAHPIWSMSAQLLHIKLPGTISIDPWRTKLELLKLVSEVAAFWLAFSLGRDPQKARLLLNAILIITAAYALYAFVLAGFSTSQASLIYGLSLPRPYISGPFMLHNSFATFCGIGLIVAVVKLFSAGETSVIADRGMRRLLLTTVQFVFGRGARWVVAVVVLFGALVASASRAGFVSTLLGLMAISIIAFLRAQRRGVRRWALLGVLVLVVPFAVFIVFSGDELGDRLKLLVDAGTADEVRLSLWAAAQRMIGVFPWTGLGLGTFEDAYPMFATQVFPFVMDKAHCDYLEFAAGIGLPAAAAWALALAWLLCVCLKGSLKRRRNAAFPAVAFGVSVLIGFHSLVDFSLQIPAVALLYALVLGLGVAQSERAKVRQNDIFARK